MSDELKDFSMVELFRLEAEGQLAALTAALLALEQGGAPEELEAMMRAAHSLKGAARIVGLDPAVQVAHVMEDAFVAAQRGEVKLGRAHVDRLLVGVDLLTRIAATPEAEMETWNTTRRAEVETFLAELKATMAGAPASAAPVVEPAPVKGAAKAPEEKLPAAPPPISVSAPAAVAPKTPAESATATKAAGATTAPFGVTTAPFGATATAASGAAREADSRYLRVTAQNLNRLLGLAGESLVESRWLRPHSLAVARMKRLHASVAGTLDQLRTGLDGGMAPERLAEIVADAQRQLLHAREFMAQRLEDLEAFDRRSTNLAHRLYDEALQVRMRPFGDGIGGLARMVRDVARQLGKEVRFQVIGEDTQVDRDILDKLEAPLGHLLRNALDHGIETPEERAAAGKPASGGLQLEARHSAGKLVVTVTDDGRGMDVERLRAAVVRKKLVLPEMAPRLSEAELLEFLFLPGFSMKEQVSEISGRGVGLDVVQSMVKAVRGTVRVQSTPGQGMRFTLQLPLTLSVVRALLAEIGGEPYAFPLGFITRTLRVAHEALASTEGRQHFEFEGQRVALVGAHEVLGRPGGAREAQGMPVIVLGEGEHRYGVAVEKFLGEHELVVHPLDPRLGKIQNIAAGALMDNGAPVLVIDVEDLVRSIEKATAGGGRLNVAAVESAAETHEQRKRVLIVDDSLTVRELERKLLEARGYAVEHAVDGMDGWNAVRAGNFDLVISDVDMPRLDGIELTKLIKADPRLRGLPVMIVSYKDREEDRRRGLDAGADYYITKGSFHDSTMVDAVRDLIGEAGGKAG